VRVLSISEELLVNAAEKQKYSEEIRKMDTSVKQKKKLWHKFVKACESQWMGGGERYKLGEDREFTDLICDVISNNFCAGQIFKQTGELVNINPKTEVSFFKIAVWAFIWWIKESENLTQRDKGEEFCAGKITEVPKEQSMKKALGLVD